MGAWKESPRHDAASHGCDAFRTFAVGYEGRRDEIRDEYEPNYHNSKDNIADTEYNLYG